VEVCEVYVNDSEEDDAAGAELIELDGDDDGKNESKVDCTEAWDKSEETD
jgi:hypothetical protein